MSGHPGASHSPPSPQVSLHTAAGERPTVVHRPTASPRPCSSPRLLRPTLRPVSAAASRVHFASEPQVQQSSASGSTGSYAAAPLPHMREQEVCAWAQGDEGTVMMPSPPGSPGWHSPQQRQRLVHHQDASTMQDSYAQQHQQPQQLYETMSWAVQPQCSPAHSSTLAAYPNSLEQPLQQQHPGWAAAHQPTHQECQQPLPAASHKPQQQQGPLQQRLQQQYQQHHHHHQQDPTPSTQQPAPGVPVQLRAGSVCITVTSPRVELAGSGAAVPSSPHQLQQRTGTPALHAFSHAAGSQGAVQEQREGPHKAQQQQQQQQHSTLPATRIAPQRDEMGPLQALQGLVAGNPDSVGQAQSGWSSRQRAPSAGVALPARLAAQHLGSLAGMSRRVQEALVHSQQLLERQAAVVEQAMLARAFFAWRHFQADQEQRRHAALAACRRVATGQLRRYLRGWQQLCSLQEGRQQVLQRAHALLRNSLLRRCWQEWRRLCALRWWKVQVAVRDATIQQLGSQLRHLEWRPVRLMQRYRLRTWLAAWQGEARYQHAKREQCLAAGKRAQRMAQLAAFAGWQAVVAEKAAQQRAQQRAERLLARLRLCQAVAAWRAVLVSTSAWRAASAAALQMWQHRMRQHALRGWRYISWFRRTARAAVHRQRLKVVAAVFTAWQRQTAVNVARAALLADVAAGHAARLVACTFFGWMGAVEGQQGRRQLEELNRLSEQAEQLAADNAHLQEECERLGRVIDSGDWSRQRVEELLQAGRVLQEERDALAQLVGSLQQQQAQQQSMSCTMGLDATCSPHLQPYRVSTMGGIQAARGAASLRPPSACPASPGAAAAARNRLLVRGGSSFNAMVRALKQDLVTSGTLQRSGPAALLEVDKLSLNHVSVAADGGMEVEAVGSPDRLGVAFGRSYPASPKLSKPASGVAAAGGKPQQMAAAAQRATALRAPARAAGHPERSSGGSSSGLLEAALRLQGIGGRSVGLSHKGR